MIRVEQLKPSQALPLRTVESFRVPVWLQIRRPFLARGSRERSQEKEDVLGNNSAGVTAVKFRVQAADIITTAKCYSIDK